MKKAYLGETIISSIVGFKKFHSVKYEEYIKNQSYKVRSKDFSKVYKFTVDEKLNRHLTVD